MGWLQDLRFFKGYFTICQGVCRPIFDLFIKT